MNPQDANDNSVAVSNPTEGNGTQPTDPNPGQPPVAPPADPLADMNIPDALKEQIKGNEDVLNLVVNNINTKREANEEAKKYREQIKAYEKEKKEAEANKLAEEGKYKELYEQQQQELEKTKATVKDATIMSKLSVLAAQKGIVKPEYLSMFDKSGLELDDAMNVEGLNEKFEAFYQANPELFKQGTAQESPTYEPPKPNITGGGSVQDQAKALQAKAQKTGMARDINTWRQFKKQHNLS